MAAQYNPTSHFFTEQNVLIDALAADLPTDGFGPIGSGPIAQQYRVTSIVRAPLVVTAVKVFAICKGRISIQPMTGDDDKVNIILKPEDSYSPLKIKYFIYRGISKADLIDESNNLQTKNLLDPLQPKLIQNLWDDYIMLNTINPDVPAPTIFQASKIGYNPILQPDNTLVESIFNGSLQGTYDHQLPMCERGDYIGNFSETLGLDIVLDFGDYRLENQQELFKFDLSYSRKREYVFDTDTIVDPTSTLIKRYKEYVHQFIDAAAFWGSHIECGSIKTVISPQIGISTNAEIYTQILNKYQTKNKIYAYIQGEKNRSYNYYEATRTVEGFATPQTNETLGWPIIIKELNITPAPSNSKTVINFNLEYNINSSIPEEGRHLSIDVIAPNNDISMYPIVQRPLDTLQVNLPPIPIAPIGRTRPITISFPINGTKSCAAFIMFYANVKQEFPLKNYYDSLWNVNFNSILTSSLNDPNSVYSATYDKSRMVNLDDILGVGVSIQNKLVFDNGLNSTPTTTRKKRRLYMAILKRNSKHQKEFDELNVNTITASKVKNIASKDQYILNLYNDNNFFIYKGTFADGTDTINSLTLIHEDNLIKRNSFFHLGITDEEYNKLIYNNIAVTLPQYLPYDADNVFFHLEEDTTFVHANIRKFRLGLRYENNLGALVTQFPTAPVNNVFVYTLDGLYYFSKEYSKYQQYFEDYPKCKVDFRIKLPYAGEFGFDWMRKGDTTASGDVDYKNKLGKLYIDAAHTIVEIDSNNYIGNFNPIPKLYKKLELEYKTYPIQWETNNNTDKYNVPILTLFPPYPPPAPGTIDLDRQAIFTPPYDDDWNRVANLVLKIEITVEPIKIELQYDTTIFNITASPIPKTIGQHNLDITIKCRQSFGIEQLIKVVAFYNSTGKGKKVGVLRISPNSKPLRYTKKILLVKVHTNIAGVGAPPPLIFSIEEQAKFLKKFLRQALSTPIIETITIDLIANPDPIFNSDFIVTNAFGNKSLLDRNTAGKYIIQYLYDYLTTTGPTPVGIAKYANYFKAFFFNDNGDPGRYGFSLEALNLLADFTNNLPSTTTHEFLHTAKVPHTFANYEGSRYAKFTYEPLTTDSIMDYSDFGASPAIPTISLYDWQGKVAKEKFEPEP